MKKNCLHGKQYLGYSEKKCDSHINPHPNKQWFLYIIVYYLILTS